MNRTDAPAKQSKPFAINGQRDAILPATPSGDNSASFESGFPPITMTLKSAGGLPPKGQDMNQILFELSALGRWQSAGAINSFDSAFATAIGGYPKGSMLLSDTGLLIYISTVDGNTSDPNAGVSGWLDLISYLNLMSGSIPIGMPFFWPSATMPNTLLPEWSNQVFLKWNGATFSAATYPKLALVIPSLTLTEARGEFPRIWDDGRGVDSGRALLSAQGDAIRNITGTVSGRNQSSVSNMFGVTDIAGAFGATGTGVNSTAAPAAVTTGAADRASTLTFNAANSPGVVTASENRPRNIAFNFLVRAK